MLTIHHLGLSQSQRILWLCEELAVPYVLRRYARDPTTGEAPAEFQSLHPMSLAPIITDNALVLPESGAIIEYIIAQYGGGRLAVRHGQANFADYLFWFHFANGTLMPSEQSVVISSLLGMENGNVVVSLLNARSDRAFLLVEQRLREVPYFAGPELTAADIMMVFPLSTMRTLAKLRGFKRRDLGPFPAIRDYLKRIGERKAYQRALQQDDPGAAGVDE